MTKEEKSSDKNEGSLSSLHGFIQDWGKIFTAMGAIATVLYGFYGYFEKAQKEQDGELNSAAIEIFKKFRSKEEGAGIEAAFIIRIFKKNAIDYITYSLPLVEEEVLEMLTSSLIHIAKNNQAYTDVIEDLVDETEKAIEKTFEEGEQIPPWTHLKPYRITLFQVTKSYKKNLGFWERQFDMTKNLTLIKNVLEEIQKNTKKRNGKQCDIIGVEKESCLEFITQLQANLDLINSFESKEPGNFM